MSLASRVSAFFLLALGVVLVGFSLTLYFLARNRLHAELDGRLNEVLESLVAAAEIEPDRIEWRPALRPRELPREGPAAILWTIVDDRHRIVDQSNPSKGLGFLRGLDVNDEPNVGRAFSHDDPEGNRWRSLIRRLRPAMPSADEPDPDFDPKDLDVERESRPASVHRTLSLVASTSRLALESTLRMVALSLAGVTVLMWLVAAVVGRKLSRRALLPVSSMAEAARAMSVDDSGQRLPSIATGDELEALATSFNGLLGRLHEALERRKRFAGDASHQLRTPLAAILGQIEVACRKERTGPEYRQVLDRVHAEGLRLQRIVEALLFLSRADSDAALPGLTDVDLAAWLPEHLLGWSAHPRATDLTFEARPGADFRVEAHLQLLGQLLDNLIENAFKYSESGSPVLVRLEKEPGLVVMAVEDGGVGLTPEEIPHVFEPFYRSTRARLRASAGIGLGLSVAKRIAQAFSGSLEAEARNGRGARFSVRLPDARTSDSHLLNEADREGSGRTHPQMTQINAD